MIENHIHDHFQAFGMCFGNKATVIFIGSETWINTIIVCGIIAMIVVVIINIRRIVFQNRRKPQGCDAQLIEIIQVAANAFKVSTMTKTRL